MSTNGKSEKKLSQELAEMTVGYEKLHKVAIIMSVISMIILCFVGFSFCLDTHENLPLIWWTIFFATLSIWWCIIANRWATAIESCNIQRLLHLQREKDE